MVKNNNNKKHKKSSQNYHKDFFNIPKCIYQQQQQQKETKLKLTPDHYCVPGQDESIFNYVCAERGKLNFVACGN